MESLSWFDRSGVLIARAWREPDQDGVRVRVIWNAEVVDNGTSGAANVAVVGNREELLELVAGWLEQVASLPQQDRAGPAGGPMPDS